jgi:hypothetical protein
MQLEAQFLRYAIPLKKAEMRYIFERTLLEVSTTLKSIFNEKKKKNLPFTSAGFGKGVFTCVNQKNTT